MNFLFLVAVFGVVIVGAAVIAKVGSRSFVDGMAVAAVVVLALIKLIGG